MNWLWIPAFAGMTILLSCTAPQIKPYTITTPAAQTGPHHILLGQPIDINTADATMLEALPGIGPALAQRIVADRQQHGRFATVSELTRVSGIGDKLLNRVSFLLAVTSK